MDNISIPEKQITKQKKEKLEVYRIQNVRQKALYEASRLIYKIFQRLIDFITQNGFISTILSSIRSYLEHGSISQQNQVKNTQNTRNSSECFNYKVTTICPHCNRSNEFIFPLENDFNTFQGRLNHIEPIVSFCSKCHKRFIISTLEICGIKDSYDKYIKAVNSLKRSGKPVILVPAVIGQRSLDIHKCYGVDYDLLNIVCFMDGNNYPNGSSFLSYPIISFIEQHIQKYNNMDFLILPCPTYKDIKERLIRNNVEESQIHYLSYC